MFLDNQWTSILQHPHMILLASPKRSDMYTSYTGNESSRVRRTDFHFVADRETLSAGE